MFLCKGKYNLQNVGRPKGSHILLRSSLGVDWHEECSEPREEAEMRTLLIPQRTTTHMTPTTAATTNVFITANTLRTLYGAL